MGDGMSDSESHRECKREERRAIETKSDMVKELVRKIDCIDREIRDHDAKMKGRREERVKLQADLEKLLR
jgi:hypothetical protein